MAQFARPDSDVVDGGWKNTITASAVDNYAAIDEATASDADYCYSANNPVNDELEVGLSNVTDPASSTGHVVRYRIGKEGNTNKVVDFTVRLRQGATEIAVWTHTNIAIGPTQFAQTLTSTQADSISDYTDLRLEFIANFVSGGGSPVRGTVTWAEFEVPSAAASPTRGLVSWAELETPLVPTRGQVSWAELETPLAPTRGSVSWAELETPLAPTRGLVSWSELETPSAAASPTRGLVSWAELEAPLVGTRGLVSWSELETPLAPTRGRVSWAEFETPLAPTRGQVSWAEFETPLAPTRGLVSFTELEVPSAFTPTRGLVSWSEFETPEPFLSWKYCGLGLGLASDKWW